MLWDDVAGDPRLGAKRNQLVTNAVLRLVEARMVHWNRSTGALQITDLGRIAAKYYIRVSSVEIFNERFRPRVSEADALRMLSYSTEVRRVNLPPRVPSEAIAKSSSIRSNYENLRQRSWKPSRREFPAK